MEDTTMIDTTPQPATREAPPRRRRLLTAAGIAVVGLIAALAWAAVTVGSLLVAIDDMPRTNVPGEFTVAIDEPATQVVYHERHTWVATFPSSADLTVEVTDPEGGTVRVADPGVPTRYRLPGVAAEAVATFEPDAIGEHVVAVRGDVDDDTVAVGPSLTRPAIGALAGPAALVLATLIVAALVAARSTSAWGGRRVASPRQGPG